jgi:hypothetical protein
MPLARDQHPVQALAAGAAYPAFRDRPRPERRTSVLMIRMPTAALSRHPLAYGLAAPPVSFLPGQAGSSHPPVAYRVDGCRFPLVRWHRTRSGAGKPVTGL